MEQCSHETMKLRDMKTVKERREALEKELQVDLKNTGSFTLDESVAASRNCENMIGVAQIPMGVAGPLQVKSLKVKVKSYFIPLATTEGALVASVNRGCKAITESGGAVVDSYRVGATRGVVFKLANLAQNDRLNNFLEEHFELLQKIAQKTSAHVTLKKFLARGVGRYCFVRFVFDTQDAMGMNMATIATSSIVRTIERKTRARCVSLAGNFDVDKKPSWLNVIEGRGFKVWAEVTLPSSVLRHTLKTSAQKIFDVWLAKCMIGSAMSGSVGFNAQYANVVAALFLATGQDPGHVAEGALGITTMEVVRKENGRNEDVYVSVYLPNLMVGTVGGGTGLATQKEALEILGVAGGNKGENAERFAEIVAGAVLAGELSLLASLSEGTLAAAHQRLARGLDIGI